MFNYRLHTWIAWIHGGQTSENWGRSMWIPSPKIISGFKIDDQSVAKNISILKINQIIIWDFLEKTFCHHLINNILFTMTISHVNYQDK